MAPSRGNEAEAQLVEAKVVLAREESFSRKESKIRDAVYKKFSSYGDDTPSAGYGPGQSSYPANGYCSIDDIFDDQVVFSKGGKHYRIDYEWSGENVVIGDEPTRIKDTWTDSSKSDVKESSIREANIESTSSAMMPGMAKMMSNLSPVMKSKMQKCMAIGKTYTQCMTMLGIKDQ